MNNKANTSLYVIGTFLIILVFGILWYVGIHNNLVRVDEKTRASWGNVQSAYQRRVDLIPNLVATVKGASTFEKDTLTEIASLRAQAGMMQTATRNANTPAEMQQVASETNSVLSRLLVIVEAYPDLKSVDTFKDLMVQLEGTENRVKRERDLYNEQVKDYRSLTRMFPTSIVAGSKFPVDAWEVFEADPGSENAPKVDFN